MKGKREKRRGCFLNTAFVPAFLCFWIATLLHSKDINRKVNEVDRRKDTTVSTIGAGEGPKKDDAEKE